MVKFYIFFFLAVSGIPVSFCAAQITIAGTVYDSSKVYSVSGVQVKSTNGNFTFTDSAGGYRLRVDEKDSISFFYRNKPTVKFPVSSITDYTQFDISLRVAVREKYKTLKEIVVFSNYHQDSAENRSEYSKVFNYEKPTLRSTYTPGSSAGADLDELINIFRFRRNKLNLQFQKRLVEQEQDRYVDFRFSTKFLKRVTRLSGDTLQRYKNEYRPSYQLLTSMTELEFYEYIDFTSSKFKKDELSQSMN